MRKRGRKVLLPYPERGGKENSLTFQRKKRKKRKKIFSFEKAFIHVRTQGRKKSWKQKKRDSPFFVREKKAVVRGGGEKEQKKETKKILKEGGGEYKIN